MSAARKSKPGNDGSVSESSELVQQAAELRRALQATEDELAARDRTVQLLRAEAEISREKVADALRSSARRLVQIKVLETTLEEQKRKEALLEDELYKQTRMMESVMNYRDKELSREYNELLHKSKSSFCDAGQPLVWRRLSTDLHSHGIFRSTYLPWGRAL